MWAEACGLLARAERLQRQFFRVSPRPADLTSWEPPVDVFETDEEFWILVALPGVLPAGMEVTVSGSVVHVRAERPLPETLRRAAVHRMEIPYGRFERYIELPISHLELRTREALHGCLVVQLRKLF